MGEHHPDALDKQSWSIGNINTLFSLFQQLKKEIREAVQP
jgi:hypothetical protein